MNVLVIIMELVKNYLGIIFLISLEGFKLVDLKFFEKLEEVMRFYGVFESEEEMLYR